MNRTITFFSYMLLLACSIVSGVRAASCDTSCRTSVATCLSACNKKICKFYLRSNAFTNGNPLPVQYSSLASNVTGGAFSGATNGGSPNPELYWAGAPKGTKTYALIVDDLTPLETVGTVVVHWVVVNLPACDAQGNCINELPAGVDIASLGGQVLFQTSGTATYRPPAANSPGIHFYRFTLFALDTTVDASQLVQPINIDQFYLAMQSHIIGVASTTAGFSSSAMI